MAKEIKNRRENILINEIPPEILTEAKLSADGFVMNTDYASGNVGGTIKTSTTYGTSVTGSGAIVAATRTLDQYNAAASNLFIGKGTMENVLLEVFAKLLRAYIPDAHWDALATNTKVMFALNKEADGTYNLDIVSQAPTP